MLASRMGVSVYPKSLQDRNLLRQASKRALERSGRFKQPIVTEINPGATFYPAEE
jgi:peptide-methionine (S)-S-oxide reductase